jgi:hypothetical protein
MGENCIIESRLEKELLNAVPTVGPKITGWFTGVVGFLGPVVLTLLVVHFFKKYFMK